MTKNRFHNYSRWENKRFHWENQRFHWGKSAVSLGLIDGFPRGFHWEKIKRFTIFVKSTDFLKNQLGNQLIISTLRNDLIYTKTVQVSIFWVSDFGLTDQIFITLGQIFS
jgi:hypothetical protein